MKLTHLLVFIVSLSGTLGRAEKEAFGLDQTINNFSFQQQQYWPGIWNKCNGKFQSPIQITTFQQTTSIKLSITFEDRPRHYKFSPDSSLKIAYPYSIIELRMPDQSSDSVYQSTSMRFKSPGEHSVEGLRGSFELIIHYRRIHGGEGNPLIILAVPVMASNSTTTDLFTDQLHITTTSFSESKNINFKQILGQLKTAQFFVYKGSLNRPPCNEIVTWIIPQTKLYIRPTTITVVKNMINEGKANNRVLQQQETPIVYKTQAQ